jgi:hypothetical protein
MSTNMIEVKEISKDNDLNLDKNKEKFRERIEKDPKIDIILKNNENKVKDLDPAKISIKRNNTKKIRVKNQAENKVHPKGIKRKESDHIHQNLQNQKDLDQFHPQIKVNKNHRSKNQMRNSKKV